MLSTLPNQLTLLRILLIPVFILVFFIPWEWRYLGSALIFSLAALTDLLDGYLARKLDQSSPFGAFLDPVADKLIVISALILLMHNNSSHIFALACIVIIGREMVVSALREWMSEFSQRANVAVTWLGKVKTTLQMIAIIVLLGSNPERFPEIHVLGLLLLYVAVALTLWSMIVYLKAAWPELLGRNRTGTD